MIFYIKKLFFFFSYDLIKNFNNIKLKKKKNRKYNKIYVIKFIG